MSFALISRWPRGLFLGAAGTVMLAATFVVPCQLQAQQGRQEVEAGNRLYAEGRYAEAHARYLEALRKAPDNPLIRFNEGNVLYRSAEFERALEAYGEVLESGDAALDAGAWYNLGNALAQGQQLPEALEAYKQALRRNPRDPDAKHNLELVLEQMQEQEQDQNQDDQNQDDQNEDENPQDQGGSDGGDQEDQQNPQEPNDGEGDSSEGGQPDDPNDEGEPNPDSGDGEGSEGGEQPVPPGQMTKGEAERLLQAVQENPDEVDRQGEQPRGRRPRKDW